MNWKKGLFGLEIAVYAYLFFLSIAMMGGGMKSSFKHDVSAWLAAHAGELDELTAFVMGVLGTSLVQSSSTVTSMAVVATQEGVIPLGAIAVAIGIVHGANLGTSVTSSIVAFFASTRSLTGNPFRDLKRLLFERRLPGFRGAVSAATVHGLFNAILVTGILLAVEIPFGLIHRASAASAGAVSSAVGSAGEALDLFHWISPKTWTKPVVTALLDLGIPGWAVAAASMVLLFVAIRGFAKRMQSGLLAGGDNDPETIGVRLLGKRPIDTFIRGLLLTLLVQSSSVTTAMVVPLAALGLFSLKRVFPFILGANIGTTTTAVIVAASSAGDAGFEIGMTVALCHFYLNCTAVILVVTVPGLKTSVLTVTGWLAEMAAEVPAVLVLYLALLAVALPVLVYFAPTVVSYIVLSSIVATLVIAPHVVGRFGGTVATPREVAAEG